MTAAGGGTDAALAAVFGVCLAGSFVEIGLSRVLGFARRLITPLVTGTVVTLIGLTLIRVGIEAMCGGPAARGDGTFASPQNLGLALLVLVVLVVLNFSSRNGLRMSSIIIALAVGYAASAFLGRVDFSRLAELDLLALPVPWITSRNLASKLLAMAARRVAEDWENRYGYRPVLMETFVETPRFAGTCYRAANWTPVGQTRGRGKLDTRHQTTLPG